MSHFALVLLELSSYKANNSLVPRSAASDVGQILVGYRSMNQKDNAEFTSDYKGTVREKRHRCKSCNRKENFLFYQTPEKLVDPYLITWIGF